MCGRVLSLQYRNENAPKMHCIMCVMTLNPVSIFDASRIFFDSSDVSVIACLFDGDLLPLIPALL